MANKAVSYLRGSVRVRIQSAWPERIFNICSARAISLREVTWYSVTEVGVTVDRRDFPTLRRAMADIGADVFPERKSGVPFLLLRVRKRYALLAGLGLLAVLLTVNSLFIWDFVIAGNETVKSEEILHVLAKNGVHRGTFAYSFRSQDLCNHALLELPELSWLTVNVRGCRAYVQVSERIRVPEITDSSASNVISRRNALVTKVRPLDGEAKVLPGTTVTQGQLLISGVVETKGVESPSVGTRFLAGRGEVWGRTWYELSVSVPLQFEAKQYTKWEKKSFALLWGEKRLKFSGKDSRILDSNCDKIINQKKWTLFGVCALPITWETEIHRAYDLVPVTRSREEAEMIGKQILGDDLTALFGEDGSVTNARYASAERNGEILVTLSAECLEQIGEVVPLTMKETFGGK